jgi:DNA-directed RNA polymerase specialized sigma24 family protein
MPMSSSGSITYWIAQLQAGDPAAAQQIWTHYWQRLVGLARAKLQALPRRAADEEDVAQGAFASFFRAAEHGRFPRLHDRNDLWQLLVMLTARKAADLVQHERRRKRGGGAVRGESALNKPNGSEAGDGLAQVVGDEPTPQFAAEVADTCQRLLARLGDPELRAVALWKMEGYSNKEIAVKLGCVPRTVKRKLFMIRTLWNQENVP